METQTNVEATNALTDNESTSGLATAGINAATSSYSNYGDSSIPAKVSKYREFVDSRYEIAKGAYTYSAYTAAVIKQENGPIPIVAFFGAKLRFPEFSEFDCPSVQFQHRDILGGDRIFMIAVSRNESDSDIYSVFVNRSWFVNLYDRFIREGKELSSATMFQSGEMGKPEEYLEILSRNQVHDMHYGFVPSTGYEAPTETFELTGTVEAKGQKMLLLHLMQEAIYDSKQFLSNQISLLEQQRMDEKFGCCREDKSSTSVVDHHDSNSGGAAEFNNGDDEVSEEEQLAPQSPKKKGSSKCRALQAIETNLRFGDLAEEHSYEGKRLKKPLIKFGSVKEDFQNRPATTTLARLQPEKTKVTEPHKVIAEKTNPPPKTTQQKAARTTKKTTKPATSTTGRRKRVQVKIEEEEEEEEEQEEEVQIVAVQKKPRGRPPFTRSKGAVSEAPAISSASNTNDLLMTMQRDYEKQFAQLKAENKKAAEQTSQQTAALTEALLKFTKDAEQRTKTRELNEQQVVMSTGRGISDRLDHTEVVPRTSDFTAPSAPSRNGFADTVTNFTATRCSSQTPNQLQLLQQSALQLHSSSIQLQNNPNNLLIPADEMSNNQPPNMAMWGAQYPQHHHLMQPQQLMQQSQHQHFMHHHQPQHQQHYMQHQPHYMQHQPYPQYYQHQPPHGLQQQQSQRRRPPNSSNGALAAFLAGMLANTQQQDD